MLLMDFPSVFFEWTTKQTIFSLEAMKIHLTDILKALRITTYHSGMVQHPRWFLKTRFIVTPNYNIFFFSTDLQLINEQ